VNRESSWIRLEQNSEIFPTRDHLPTKNIILGGFRRTSGARVPALAFTSTTNLSIASYSRRAKGVSSSSDFFRTTYLSRVTGMQLTFHFGKFAKFCYISAATTASARYTYRLHIWQLGRSNGGVAPTVTSGDFYLLLWPWYIIWRKVSRKQDLGDYPDTAALSYIVTQLHMILRCTPKYDLDLRKKVETLHPFPFYSFSMLRTGPTVERSYLAGRQMWGRRRSLGFLANLDLLWRLRHIFKWWIADVFCIYRGRTLADDCSFSS